MSQQHLLNVRAKEKERDITLNLFETYSVEPKIDLPVNEINHLIGLTAELIKRPYGMVCGLTSDWSKDELRDIYDRAQKETRIPKDKKWWSLRKERKLKYEQKT